MKERPILFSGPMVRAILEGRKTQTRRLLKMRSCEGLVIAPSHCENVEAIEYFYQKPVICPYGQPGSRLWVRETWAHDGNSLEQVRREHEDVFDGIGHGPYYRADTVHENTGLRWRPSIHMPRWASRITLELTKVRVERLHDIGKDGRNARDVLAEGITEQQIDHWRKWLHPDDAPAHTYGVLWDSLNAKRGFGWDKNPWVWVLEFHRL